MTLTTTIERNEEEIEVIIDFNLYEGEPEINSVTDLDGNVYTSEHRELQGLLEECHEKACDVAAEGIWD